MAVHVNHAGAQPGPVPSPGGGLLSQGAPADPAVAAAGSEQPNVSPDEQAQYEEFVNNAFSAIYDDRSLQQILEGLKGDGNPVDGLANTAAMTVVRVEDSAVQAGQKISPDVVFQAGIEILEDLADLAEKAGIHSFTEQEIEGATYQAMDVYREARGGAGGQSDPGVADDFQQIINLDRAGKLGDIAPGLAEKVGGGVPNAA